MRKVGVEVVGLGALKVTGFLRELMQRRNIHFESLYTIRSLKEVFLLLIFTVYCYISSFCFFLIGNSDCGMRCNYNILQI